jgi:Sap, sulfolipid-1-addressing protein
MVTQAAGLAVLAAISPTALLVAVVFLGAANPRQTVLLYLAGAIVTTGVLATVVFIVLRAGHLYKPHEHQTRYGLRLGLGVLLLLLGAFLLWRSRRNPDAARQDSAKQRTGVIARLTSRPSRRTAFLVGLLVYAPSLTFIAAVQVVATAKVSTTSAVLALVLVVGITVVFVWLPLVLYLLAPDRTGRLLRRFDAWLRSHGRQLLVGAVAVAGVLLTADGIIGLA